MTATKLSDTEKQQIIELYRETEENTVTLAERYGVSSSTVRRILQGAVPVDEYKALVQQKQKRSHSQSQKSHSSSSEDTDTDFDEDEFPNLTLLGGRRRKISSSLFEEDEEEDEDEDEDENEEKEDVSEENYDRPEDLEEILEAELPRAELEEFDREEAEDLEDFGEDELEEDEEFDEKLEASYTLSVPTFGQNKVQILPLSEAVIPKICYLVVDRSTELVTPPLMAFGELGQIPSEEYQEKTLPVFDNHRVAKRFSARNQRVLKVPDGRMLKQTSSYLQAKGITRLLIDGQVYRF
jgi:hypothetical protein